MILENQKQTLSKTNHTKNFIILFGACICLLTITSFNNWISSNEANATQGIQCTLETQVKIDKDTPSLKEEQKFKSHHNFIASYLLQESSFERKIKKTEERQDFFSNLKQLHKIIISQTSGLF
jgi:hypothetical protein